MLRYAPYASIILLPVYALLLQISFAGGARRIRRPRLYAAHLVFAAHWHAFMFVVAMLFAVVPSVSAPATRIVGRSDTALVAMK